MERYTLTLTASDGKQLGRWDTGEDFGDLNELLPLLLLTAAIQRCVEAHTDRGTAPANQ